ncbi:MAG: hypothetical protein HFG02_04050 [Oscillibacter sp.]|nr:hypothetical protein [Oscillibacter sp.]
MSMPSFPPNGAAMTREEALTMIIASIAMEELALSHILNAEGEKLQYILKAGATSCASPQDVLAVNKSVTALLEAVVHNQMLLKGKLERVLEFCPPPAPPCPPPPCGPEPCPCPPPPCIPEPCPCPPPPCRRASCEKSTLQLAGQREGMLWNRGCRLPWRLRVRRGTDICWDSQSPTQIRLNPEKSYTVRYTLNVRGLHPSEEAGTILLKQTPFGAFTETPPLHFTLKLFDDKSQTLQYTAVLHPRMASECELSLALDAKSALCVEQAVLDVTTL